MKDTNQFKQKLVPSGVAMKFLVLRKHHSGSAKIVRKEKSKEISSMRIVRIKLRIRVRVMHDMIEFKGRHRKEYVKPYDFANY